MSRLVQIGRRIGLSASALLGSPRLFGDRNGPNVSALLFHRFFSDDETRQQGIDRLRRELEWLRSTYNPMSLSDFVGGLASGSLPDRAVLVTTDDAHRDVLHVVDEFNAFEVPFAVFVCVGWTATASRGTGEDLLARTASAIQWYEGADVEIGYGNRVMALSGSAKAANIDALITDAEIAPSELEELCSAIEALKPDESHCCSWDEVRQLVANGVQIGAHSVTHINLSQATPTRRKFEIAESKRLCETMIGQCEAFAYPYGTDDAHSPETRAELLSERFSAAFLTHSGFITPRSDPFTLPRLSMPDEPMAPMEFRARAQGAGIVARRIKQALRRTG